MMRAMILAAGRGERMRPLTDTLPKPLLQAGGRSLIEYHIENLARAGVEDIVINVAWKGSLIRDALGDGRRFGVRLHFSDEGDAALETGGGVFRALPWLGTDAFLVISGDIWSDYPLSRALSLLSPADVAHFVLVPNPAFHQCGDFCLDGSRVTDGEGPRYTYANIGVLRPQFFAGCSNGRFAIAPLMRTWIRAGRVSGELYQGKWRNIGTPAQLTELDRELTVAR
jgi:N-acetyl-alpha-D-muramate 1-phosphate uridylyltransferase